MADGKASHGSEGPCGYHVRVEACRRGSAAATVTSHDVARLAGVSQATVSRALRDDARVTEATKLSVREAARALGYVRSELGRSLSTRRTNRVALVVELENTLYHQLMSPIHDALAARGYRMLLLAEHSDELTLSWRLLDRSVDGAVLLTTRLNSSLPIELRRRGLPFVLLNRLSGVVEAPSISADNVGGARSAAELLLGLGHTRIGVILGPSDTSTGRDREAGFRQALDDAGVALNSKRVVRGGFDHASGRTGLRALLEQSNDVTAILCANDEIAIGVLNGARELGVDVPGDIAVVGFDDIDMAGWPQFALTTVHNPLQDMARRAAELLLDVVEERTPTPDHQVFPTSLVVRRTHGL